MAEQGMAGAVPPPGGYGPLSPNSVVALEQAARVLAQEHALANGATALFWHLISAASRHVVVREEGTP